VIGLAQALLVIAALCVGIPMAVWSLQCAASLLPPQGQRSRGGARPAVAILVPAHDEAAVIRQTLASLAPQVLPGDRLVVIADNCSDETAAIARKAGAAVLERTDALHRAKIHALEFAVGALAGDAPEVYIVIDADCTVHPGAVQRIAQLAFETGRPVQATYLMELPQNARPLQPLAALAFRIKNLVRPSGLQRLGYGCFLSGSGMAFPADCMRSFLAGNSGMAEDVWGTVNLALAGRPPLFCRDALVTSCFPSRHSATVSQKSRWMHGHLDCLLGQGPRLFAGVIRQRRLDLFILLLDLAVPPLSLLILLWCLMLAVALAAGLAGIGWMPLIPVAAAGAAMAAAFVGVLARFGDRRSARALWAIPGYIASQIPILAAFAGKRDRRWIRTERDGA
jgi:cellulose synthase/poly-beta-1,6-N-acetylglucosamine synthase-like glycosyltransferase